MSDENNMNPLAENIAEKAAEATQETAENAGEKAAEVVQETAENAGEKAAEAVQETAENAEEKAAEAVQETAENAAEEAGTAVKPVHASRAAMIKAAEAAVAQETAVENAVENTVESTGKKKKKIPMWEVTPENDISYKGFLSYRHFRIAAWVCMALTVANIFLGLGMKISPDVADKYGSLHNWFSFFAEFGVFLFLFANFAVIIDKKSSYKKLFILYGALTIGFVLLFAIIFYRYAGGLFNAIGKATGDDVSVNKLLNGGFKAFNVFLDMLLCTAVLFFIDYRPTKWFVGKKIYIFRAFAAIPILYELGCILIKYFATVDGMKLHPMVSPFLTTKPVFCFLLFVRMAFYIKGRETKFIKHGKTHADYEAYLKTNRNSFQFSKKFSLMCVIYGALDFVFVLILFFLRLANAGALGEYMEAADEEVAEVSDFIINEVKSIGFGGAALMLLIAPFILLFSYTKSYKKSKIDTLLPAGAIVVIGLIVLEGIFRLLCLVPDKVSVLLGF